MPSQLPQDPSINERETSGVATIDTLTDEYVVPIYKVKLIDTDHRRSLRLPVEVWEFVIDCIVLQLRDISFEAYREMHKRLYLFSRFPSVANSCSSTSFQDHHVELRKAPFTP